MQLEGGDTWILWLQRKLQKGVSVPSTAFPQRRGRVLKLRRAGFDGTFRRLQTNSWLLSCGSIVLELLCF